MTIHKQKSDKCEWTDKLHHESIVQIQSLKLNPNPAVRGKIVKLHLKAKTNEPIWKGKVYVKTKFLGFVVDRDKFTLQSILKKCGYNSEIPKGDFKLDIPHYVPNVPFKGSATVVIKVVNNKKVTLTKFELKAKFV